MSDYIEAMILADHEARRLDADEFDYVEPRTVCFKLCEFCCNRIQSDEPVYETQGQYACEECAEIICKEDYKITDKQGMRKWFRKHERPYKAVPLPELEEEIYDL